MRYSPLQFYFADILYFIFYFPSPNLGHFGPKPVGLLPCASVQLSALVHPVQPTHPVPHFQESFSFTTAMIQPLDPMAPMTTCAALWPLPMLLKLHGRPSWFSSSHHALPAAQPPEAFLASTSLQPPRSCTPLLLYLRFFFKAPVVLDLLLLGLQFSSLLSPVWA